VKIKDNRKKTKGLPRPPASGSQWRCR